MLTSCAVLSNTNLVIAKSMAGFGDSNTLPGAQAPILSGAFFVPEGFLYGCAHWETFGSAGYLVLRFANPMRAATIVFGETWCQLVFNQYQDLNMNSDVFVLRDNPAPADLATELHTLSIQMQAVLESASEISSCRKTLADYSSYTQFSALLWALDSMLEKNKVLAEELTLARLGEGGDE